MPNAKGKKKKKRKLEREVRKHDTPENREAYRAQVAYYRSVLSIKRNDFYTLNFSSKISKMIFYCLNELMNYKNDTLPVNSSTFDLAVRFNIFFKRKVNDIVDELPKTNSSLDCTSNDLVVWSEFASVFPINLLDVLDDLRTSESPVDIIPTRFLKDFIAENIQFFTDLFNCILLSGVFPDVFKQGVIRPLLKHGLNQETMSSYHPITNLSALSKIMEKLVLSQPQFQSAYRKGYSTESGILLCSHYIYSKIDSEKCFYVVQMDFSAAFDTIDHSLLLKILENKIGIAHTVKQFFETYLSNRFVQVLVNSSLSDKIQVETGVPQGSVLGSILFILYLQPLLDYLIDSNIAYHFYADDSQLFLEINLMQNNHKLENIEKLCSQLHLSLNKNDGKTEKVFYGRQLHHDYLKPVKNF